MKKIIYTLFLSLALNLVYGQILSNPVCDEVMEIPYTFSYSGFILIESYGQISTDNFSLKVGIAEDSPDGPIVFSENHTSPFKRTGFFNVDIGSKNTDDFLELVQSMNNVQLKDYYIVVDLVVGGQYKNIGSKLIQTVPYALVANSLGGIGPRGENGEDSTMAGINGVDGSWGADGASGATGATGVNGVDGADGFGIMIMRDYPPNSQSIYVDDGTNTEDGKPHIRYKLSNGNWIDL